MCLPADFSANIVFRSRGNNEERKKEKKIKKRERERERRGSIHACKSIAAIYIYILYVWLSWSHARALTIELAACLVEYWA